MHKNTESGFRFNEDAKDLYCEGFFYFLCCLVPESHFSGKKSGYYFLNRKNPLNGYSTYYNIPPVKVILSNSSSSTALIVLGVFGGIAILGLITFTVIYIKKKRTVSADLEKDNIGRLLK